MKYLVFSLFCITLLISCSQSKSDGKPTKTILSEQIVNEDSTSVANLDKWLSNQTLIKPKKLFLEILKRAQDSAINKECDESFFASIQNESQFKEMINEFKVIPLKDKYLLVRGINTWTSSGVGTIISLINNKDSIISFRYECLLVSGSPDIRTDSIYVDDWKKTGNSDLMVKEFSRFSNNSHFQIDVYDFTSKESQIIKSFDYCFFQEYRDQYWIYRSKDSISFEKSGLIKVVTNKFDVPRKIRKEDYDDINYYKHKLKKQEEAKDTSHESPRYYKLDSVSKLFEEIKQ